MSAFTDNVVILTGASEGIGRALALALAPQRPRLVVAARNLERLETLAHGTPEEVARGEGHTARYLRDALEGPQAARRISYCIPQAPHQSRGAIVMTTWLIPNRPTMAKISPAEPSLASSPRPRRAMP